MKELVVEVRINEPSNVFRLLDSKDVLTGSTEVESLALGFFAKELEDLLEEDLNGAIPADVGEDNTVLIGDVLVDEFLGELVIDAF